MQPQAVSYGRIAAWRRDPLDYAGTALLRRNGRRRLVLLFGGGFLRRGGFWLHGANGFRLFFLAGVVVFAAALLLGFVVLLTHMCGKV